ncbi:MAG: hypothetical protein QXT31_03435 [Candidatus Bathyarchaeia archaeon]
MKFKFIKLDFEGELVCFCELCKGKYNPSVKHYKLFSIKDGKEYYLSINEKENLISIEEKI